LLLCYTLRTPRLLRLRRRFAWLVSVAVSIVFFVTFLGIVCTHAAQAQMQTQPPRRAWMLDSLESSWKTYQASEITDTSVTRLLNRLTAEFSTDNPSKAREYAFIAKRVAERIGDRYALAVAFKNLGMLFLQQSNFNDALESYLAARKLFEELQSLGSVAETQRAIGIVHSKQKNFTAAIESMRKAQDYYETAGNKFELSKTYLNLGTIYWANTQPQRALEFYWRSSSLQEEIGDRGGLVASLTSIGAAYHELQRLDSAAVYAFRALKLAQQDGIASAAPAALRAATSSISIVHLYFNIASIYLDQNRINDALVYLQKVITLTESTGDRESRCRAYGLLADLYEEIKQPDLALPYFRRYSYLSDSLYSERSARLSAEMDAKYDLVQKETDLVKKESEIQQQRQQQRNLLIGLVLIVIIAVLLLYGYNIKQKSELVLQQKNLELGAANLEISRQNVHLEELNSEKNEFLGIVAHDLKNPILSIRLLAQILHDQDTTPPEERQRYTDTIVSSSDQMTRIINNLLDVNAIEQGGIKLDPTEIDLSIAAYNVFEEYETIAANKGVKLHYHSTSDAECLADQMALTQILDNLISNAVKYSPSGKNVWIRVSAGRAWQYPPLQAGSAQSTNGKSLEKSLDKSLGKPLEQSQCVRVEIQDEGPGLSADDKKKLFGKFVRLSAQPTAGERSTGLGLSIVKKMVTVMHGHVWCESELGRGATFIVELPAVG
jgi:signal transduction histidine kinase